jgi:four helix bundle protein
MILRKKWRCLAALKRGESGMAKGEDLLERLIRFGVLVLDLSSTLPKTTAGRHMADQLMRSATAGAPTYAEARSGESLRDFVHKLGIVRKELNESYVWLRMLNQSGIGSKERLGALLKECDELCRIISASKKTAETRLKQERVGNNKL